VKSKPTGEEILAVKIRSGGSATTSGFRNRHILWWRYL